MTAKPSDFPPPVTPDEFIAAPQAPEEEAIEVGVLFVGGGPAGLAGAIRLGQLLADDPDTLEKLGEVPIAVVDKGKTIGAHQLSGAVVKPGPLKDLFPDTSFAEMSAYGEVQRESVYVMTKKKSFRIPTPPPFHNKGNHVFSLSKLGRYLAEQAEELGVMLLPETDAQQLLVEGGAVRGIKSGDKGRGKEGEELANFEPGMEVTAKATVLSEGTQGHLAGALLDHFDLRTEPQVYALGVKEVWKVARPLDRIIHTMGWPLRKSAKYREFGGSFIYPMGDDHICVGMVVGLDHRDASLSVHDVLQEFKLHPLVSKLLEGGKRVQWGAKTIPEGGFYSLPKQLTVPGAVLTGDSAGFVNVPTLKGVHYAIRSGMLAAEEIYAQLKAGTDLASEGALSGYDRRIADSEIHKDLHRSRNMRQVFSKGFFLGGALAGLMDLTGGRFPGGHWSNHSDADTPMFDSGRTYPKPDGKLTFDKLSSVFASGNKTRDDQPNHVRVQTEVAPEVASTWVNMCPAAVYELDEGAAASGDGGGGLVHVNIVPSNCVHCGAITAKGGRLTPPEGGSGPEYTVM